MMRSSVPIRWLISAWMVVAAGFTLSLQAQQRELPTVRIELLTRAISKRGRLLRRLNEVRAQTSAQAATLSQDKARVDDRAAAIVRLCGRQ